MERSFRLTIIFVAFVATIQTTTFAQTMPPATSSSNSASARLRAFLERDWKYWMTEYPVLATLFGYPGQNDRWTDYSTAAIDRRNHHLESSLRELHSIARSELPSGNN